MMKTAKILEECSIPYHVFVEPQQYDAYKKKSHSSCTVINIERDDKGISYSRQFIMQFARVYEWQNFWMIDDDIQEFGITTVPERGKECSGGKRTVKQNSNVLYKAQHQLLKHDISLGSLQLRQFAWSGKELVSNRIAMQCYLFNMKNCQMLNFDTRLLMREDYDITMQAIFKGKGTLRTSKYYYGSDDMKSGNTGGMQEFYNLKNERENIAFLKKKWPGIFEETDKKNRIDVKINWRKIPK